MIDGQRSIKRRAINQKVLLYIQGMNHTNGKGERGMFTLLYNGYVTRGKEYLVKRVPVMVYAIQNWIGSVCKPVITTVGDSM